MLAIIGVFFYMEAPTLLPDIPINGDTFAAQNYNYTYVEDLYNQNAINCWITAAIYLVIFILCSARFYVNVQNILRVKKATDEEWSK
jgi:ABC-type multidrug transport system permease subunit